MNKLTESRYGQFIYPDKDIYIGKSLELYGEYSYFETEFLKSLVEAGDIVVDVGANIGALTVPLAQKIGPSGYMLAFEPQQYIYYILCGNIALNNLTNTHIFQRAVKEKSNEIITIPIFDYEKEANFGSMSSAEKADGIKLGSPVKTIMIDDLKLSVPKLIKIDVEGEEYNVLQGARSTIERSLPYLYVECIEENQIKPIVSFFKEINYDFKFHQPPMFNENNFFGNKTNELNKYTGGEVVSGNFFAFSKEKGFDFSNHDFFVELEHSLHHKSLDDILKN